MFRGWISRNCAGVPLVVNLTTIGLLITPPLVGGIIGYFTNDLAINMLFRPYRPIYLGRRRLPFTPGLIPSNQERLAQRVSNAIMGSLLTPVELQNLARKLLETHRVQQGIFWLLDLAISQLQGRQDGKTTRVLANILQDLVDQSLPRLLRVWSRREDFLAAQLNQIFDQVLLELRLDEHQSQQVTDWLLDKVLTPDVLRQALVDFLTDHNIQVIDKGLREQTTGTYWVVANIFGLRNALLRLRSYCLDDHEAMNAKLAELIAALALPRGLQEWLQNLSLQQLPVAAVRQLRTVMRQSVRGYLQDQGSGLIRGLSPTVNWEAMAQQLLNRLTSSAIMRTSLDIVSQELALVLERYLERDLELIVEQAIPVLGIDQVIMERVKATAPQDLETAIQGIVKSELRAIVNLGGILGFTIGALQSLLLYLQR